MGIKSHIPKSYRFIWFEPICGINEKMKMVCCRICNEIKGKE